MLTSWRLANFKSVRDEVDLAMAPLTIFAGANSSGKSSLIQSMLLIAQSLTSQVEERPILLNGPLTRLGEFNDIRSFNGRGDSIKIGWTAVASQPRTAQLGAPTELANVDCDIELFAHGDGPTQLDQLNPALRSISFTSQLRDSAKTNVASFIGTRSTVPISDRLKSRNLSLEGTPVDGLSYDVQIDDLSAKATLGQNLTPDHIIGFYMRHFVAAGVFVRIDRVSYLTTLLASFDTQLSLDQPMLFQTIESGMLKALRRGLTNEQLMNLGVPVEELTAGTLTYFTWRSGIERRLQWNIGDKPATTTALSAVRSIVHSYLQHTEPRFSVVYASLRGDLSNAAEYLLTKFAPSIKYLGPLRDEPRPLQPLGIAAEQKNIGLRGEHSAAAYNLYKNTWITYIPSSSFAAASEEKPTVVRAGLHAALLDWLRYMGLAEDVRVIDRGKHGHELQLTTEGVTTLHDLTHVGVGVSQVFPIVLSCLLADSDSTLIFEQPELHLHPRVQAQLADFFLSVALSGKQCIIETHSEYLINRLRFRAVSMTESPVSGACKIYFVEKYGGSSHFREIAISEYGAIPDWPLGFFDQSQVEAEEILKAAVRKKKLAKQ